MQVLVEQLREQVRTSDCPVRLCVAVATGPGVQGPFMPVLKLDNGRKESGQIVEAETGQAIRYEVTVDTEGYLTVLNFGVEAKVEVFLPRDPRLSRRIVPGRAEKLITALAPPVGKEYMAVIWTRQPSQLNGDEWHGTIGAAGERGQVLVLSDGESIEDWTAVVLPVVQGASDQ